MAPMSPRSRPARLSREDSLHPPHDRAGPTTEQSRRGSHDSATPTGPLLFFLAALALRENLLSGGSSFALAVGLVCLTLSLGLPLFSRLEHRRRTSSFDFKHGR